jgi:hypothetical protein
MLLIRDICVEQSRYTEYNDEVRDVTELVDITKDHYTCTSHLRARAFGRVGKYGISRSMKTEDRTRI